MPTHDTLGMQRAREAATQSHCARTQVGAAVMAMWATCNDISYTAGVCTDHCARCADTSVAPRTGYDVCLCIHAEARLIARAAYHGIALAGQTMYVTLRPCLPCLRLCVAAGITRVVYGEDTAFSDAEEAAIATFTRITGIAVVRWEGGSDDD